LNRIHSITSIIFTKIKSTVCFKTELNLKLVQLESTEYFGNSQRKYCFWYLASQIEDAPFFKNID